ncbi:hypothetical protein MTO96_018489 [Rhipicephalus appendiculatus]
MIRSKVVCRTCQHLCRAGGTGPPLRRGPIARACLGSRRETRKKSARVGECWWATDGCCVTRCAVEPPCRLRLWLPRSLLLPTFCSRLFLLRLGKAAMVCARL